MVAAVVAAASSGATRVHSASWHGCSTVLPGTTGRAPGRIMMKHFEDRADGGRQLAKKLRSLHLERPIVVAVPRGGVPVAFEVASALDAPMEVLVARKVSAPYQSELGIGAVAEGGAIFLNDDLIARLRVRPEYLETAVAEARAEVERRVSSYRRGRQPLELVARTVILVDDGLATGVTTRAAIRALRERGVGALVLAVPVAALATAAALEREVDTLVTLQTAAHFRAVGYWYRDFRQSTDDEVIALLERAGRQREPDNDATYSRERSDARRRVRVNP